jgi:hypothetical protein
VSFDYFTPAEAVAIVGTCAAAIPVAVFGIRWRDSRIADLLPRVQTGSVNDYAAYLVVGLLASVVVVAGGAFGVRLVTQSRQAPRGRDRQARDATRAGVS